MPTPTLPLLHSLLRSLHIPIFPQSLGSTSPSLLLIILETLLGHQLPLPPSARLCSTPQGEVAVTKCLLGVLANDMLGIDLTIIDPARLVGGGEAELAVVVMALVVVAKRRGVNLRLPSPTDGEEGDVSVQLLEAGEDSPSPSMRLISPLEPDRSYSSSGPGSSLLQPSSEDVFTSAVEDARPSSSRLFVHEDLGAEAFTRNLLAQHWEAGEAYLGDERDPISPLEEYFMHHETVGTCASHHPDHLHNAAEPKQTSDTSAVRREERTILQHMMEEFGLGLES